MKEVTLYKIVKERILVGDGRDIFQLAQYDQSNIEPVVGTSDMAVALEDKVEIHNVRIERVRCSGRPDVHMAIHPKDNERILLFVEKKEINHLNGNIESLEGANSRLAGKVNIVARATFWTRLKWVFIGVKV